MAEYARNEINNIGGYYAYGKDLINGTSIYDYDVTKLYDRTDIRTDTVISRIVHKHCNCIRILFDCLLHTRHFHSKRNSEFWIHFRIQAWKPVLIWQQSPCISQVEA